MAEVMQSLHRSLDILEELAKYPKGRSISEISQKLDINKSTVHRILQVLLSRGYVEQDARSKDYKVGLKVVELGTGYLDCFQLNTEAHPYLEKLSQDTGCIVHLAVLSDREIVYIDKVNGSNKWQLYSEIGKRAYIHSTGLGKAFLFTMSDEEVLYYVKKNGFVQRTSNTLVREKELLENLAQCRTRGYAIDDEENEYGVKCVAVPVYDYRGEVIAAISAANKVEVMTGEKTKEVAVVAKRYAQQISKGLGYPG